MRNLLLISLIFQLATQTLAQHSSDEKPSSVTHATYNNGANESLIERRAVTRIRQIVLHHGNNPRALANLVQLTRELNNATAARLFLDLADHYLQQAQYNQAANFLQQLLNQYPEEESAQLGLLKLIRLYSSAEVNHTQQHQSLSTLASSASGDGKQAFHRYALHVANNAISKNPTFKKNTALTFQRSVTARGAGRTQLANGLLTQLKHDSTATAWRDYARVEPWLQEDREGEPPVPVIACRRADRRPHLDGMLNDSIWQLESSVQLAYDEQFLYLAVRYPKQVGVSYQVDDQPRRHDVDLSGHDHVRLQLDLDRDYATFFELAVDHRGQTADRCWRDTDWNPTWFVATMDDASHWTAETAIAWEQLTSSPPQVGDAWALRVERVLPSSTPEAVSSTSAEASSLGGTISLLLFE